MKLNTLHFLLVFSILIFELFRIAKTRRRMKMRPVYFRKYDQTCRKLVFGSACAAGLSCIQNPLNEHENVCKKEFLQKCEEHLECRSLYCKMKTCHELPDNVERKQILELIHNTIIKNSK